MKNRAMRLWTKVRHPGVFLKIMVLFVAILLAAIFITSSYIVKRFSNSVMEKEIMLGDMNLENMVDFCNDKYNRIYSLYNYIHSGPISKVITDTAHNVEEGYEIKNIEMTSVFSKGVFSADPDISDVILVSTSGIVYSYTGDGYFAVKPSFDFLAYSEIKEFIDSEENIRVVYDNPSSYALKKREPVISFLGKIYDSALFPRKKLSGVFIMNVPLQKMIEKNTVLMTFVDGEIILVNKSYEILFSTKKGQWGEMLQKEKLIKDAENYVNIKEVGTSGMKAVYSLPNQSLLKEIHQINYQIYKVMFGFIILTLMICLVIYRIFDRQAQVLIQSMARLQKGDFSLKIPIKTHDEIGIISQAFNEMCEKLNAYISEVYAAEIQRKNAELNALQTQIDPHFLYNTLDSIRAKALMEKDEDTAEMIVLLGKLFRWSSKTKDKFITLDDELEYIETYLKLQKYRYDDQLEVDIQVPDEYKDDIVPKLILQPLVENVIVHAFAGTSEKGMIGISVKEKHASKLEITVYDNGIGMLEAELQEMYSKLNQQGGQDDFKSIGLQNVQMRIKLLFGADYGLQIKSISGLGTAVKVVLPVLTEKDVRDGCINYLL